MQPLQAILSNILSISGYSSEAAIFINNFMKHCFQLAYKKAVTHLAPEQQEKVKKQFKSAKTYQDALTMLYAYIPQQTFVTLLNQIYSQQLQQFLHTISPNLSIQQKKQLTAYLLSLKKHPRSYKYLRRDGVKLNVR